jgi:hypothetical protein
MKKVFIIITIIVSAAALYFLMSSIPDSNKNISEDIKSERHLEAQDMQIPADSTENVEAANKILIDNIASISRKSKNIHMDTEKIMNELEQKLRRAPDGKLSIDEILEDLPEEIASDLRKTFNEMDAALKKTGGE